VTRSHLWILGSLLLATAAQAQTDQADLVRPSGAADLNNNLAKLATNPRDFNALVGAGEAALELDDARAAAGFFARADAIQPNNGRTKAGLGRVMLKMQNPAEALRLFDQATRAGYPEASIQGDRGLARDMTGDQAGAQRDYHAALQRTPDDAELVRRYAASLGISGQVEAADKVLQPLLYKSDRAAWRYNAFILAMNNRQAEAKKVVDQTMPAQLASAINPYMQKMPYLTAAQKAAAVHFGHFPQVVATSITPIVPTPPAPGVQLASRDAAPVAAASTTPVQGDRRTTRNGSGRQRGTSLARAPLGTPAASQPSASQPAPTQSRTQVAAQATQPAAPTPTPAPATVQPLPADTRGRQPVVQPTSSQSARSEIVQPVPGQATTQTPAPTSAPAPIPAPSPAPVRSASADVQGPPAPGLDALDGGAPRSTAPAPTTSQPSTASQLNSSALAQASGVTPPGPQGTPPAPTPSAPVATEFTPPADSAAPPPSPEATRSLADIIHAIDVPDSERRSNVVAVDLAEVEKLQAARRAAARQAEADKAKKAAVAKAKAEADAKAKKEAEEKKRLAANPARNWVQIGTGQKSALAFTMKRLRGKYEAVAPQDGWSASWGQTSRLLIGPFASFTRARAVESDLKKAGADAFAWQSDAGEVVEKLGSK